MPVNPKVVLDYFRIVTKPMDLQTLKANVRERKYESREQFLVDVHQILENSKLYNGPKSVYTLTAQNMFDLTLRRFAEASTRSTSCLPTSQQTYSLIVYSATCLY